MKHNDNINKLDNELLGQILEVGWPTHSQKYVLEAFNYFYIKNHFTT